MKYLMKFNESQSDNVFNNKENVDKFFNYLSGEVFTKEKELKNKIYKGISELKDIIRIDKSKPEYNYYSVKYHVRMGGGGTTTHVSNGFDQNCYNTFLRNPHIVDSIFNFFNWRRSSNEKKCGQPIYEFKITLDCVIKRDDLLHPYKSKIKYIDIIKDHISKILGNNYSLYVKVYKGPLSTMDDNKLDFIFSVSDKNLKFENPLSRESIDDNNLFLKDFMTELEDKWNIKDESESCLSRYGCNYPYDTNSIIYFIVAGSICFNYIYNLEPEKIYELLEDINKIKNRINKIGYNSTIIFDHTKRSIILQTNLMKK